MDETRPWAPSTNLQLNVVYDCADEGLIQLLTSCFVSSLRGSLVQIMQLSEDVLTHTVIRGETASGKHVIEEGMM
jgi:hypothetical protein